MNNIKNSEIKILMVDDNLDNLNLYSKYLKFYEYDVETAKSAKEAIEKIKKGSYYIVVTDMRMEKLESGFDVLDEINRNQLTTFVIILTANASVEGCRKACKNQAWDYISKTEDYNIAQEIDKSIKTAMIHLEKYKGHLEDKNWVDENREELLKKYTNQYIAVLHRKVVAFGESKDEIIKQLLEQKISPYLAYVESFRLELSRDKMTVFVEGPTDIKYLEKAIEIFEQDELKEKIKFDLVGDKSGQFGNGEKNMINAFAFLKENKEFRKDKKVLLLFDNDIKDDKLPNKGEDYENIHIARMGEYLESLNGIKGVETFLNSELYEKGFENGFIKKTTTSYRNEKTINYKIEQKMAFCNWIIENRADKNNFHKFQKILTLINSYLKKED